ncbi:uncharacterized protein METZ01_LOCUS10204 [marine metagenome]|uniref:Uncharacterized protein n=1 Tax=marine metagenome TaxID=408172 RepID=A0A381NS19_9ZZZZ
MNSRYLAADALLGDENGSTIFGSIATNIDARAQGV